MRISVVTERRSYSVDLTEGSSAIITVGRSQTFRVVLSDVALQESVSNSWVLNNEVPDNELVAVFVEDDLIPKMLGPGETCKVCFENDRCTSVRF